MELRDGPRLAGARVLEVDRAHQVVVAPDVLAHQVHLEIMLVSYCEIIKNVYPIINLKVATVNVNM